MTSDDKATRPNSRPFAASQTGAFKPSPDRWAPSAALQDPELHAVLAGRSVLITGACGLLGLELCRQLLSLRPARVVALDNNENGLSELGQEFSALDSDRLTLVLADITDEDRISQVFRRYRPEMVFHAAAYKHAPLLESHPEEAVFVNVHGTLNLCRTASQHECERFVFMSADQASHPRDVFGFSKRLGELIVQSQPATLTVFCGVRVGDFSVSIREIVTMVIQAGAFARSGEIFALANTTGMALAPDKSVPTGNPTIFQICDDNQTDLNALHRSVITLVQLARMGEPEIVRQALEELAFTRVARPAPNRLHSLATAVERAVASSADLVDDSLKLERRTGLDRRTGSNRRVLAGGYYGPERRQNMANRRTRLDRRQVVTALVSRFRGQSLPA